jgi:hypothetical protein
MASVMRTRRDDVVFVIVYYCMSVDCVHAASSVELDGSHGEI